MKKLRMLFLLLPTIAILFACSKVESSNPDVITEEEPANSQKKESVDNKAEETTVVINEVCSKNTKGITAGDGGYYDWIELYNTADTAFNLMGCGLSDKASDPYEYVFPNISIEAGGFLLVYADSGVDLGKGELIADFGLSTDGETITLTSPDGLHMDTFVLPAIAEDVSYGRIPDGSSILADMASTPDATNNATETMSIIEPAFSVGSGFYGEEFELSLTAPAGYRVYYTTDGSTPTENSEEYSVSLHIYDRSADANIYSMIEGTTTGNFYAPTSLVDKATVIRAIAYDEEGNASNVITKTYFVDFGNKAEYYDDVAVISLVTDPENLFDYDKGIYVTGVTYDNWLENEAAGNMVKYWHQPANYKNRGDEWERETHIELIETDGRIAFSQDVGLRVRGGASGAFLQKGFNVYARNDYGNNRIRYEMFPDLKSADDGSKIDTFKSIMLRNGGNDTELTKIREVMIHQLASDLNVPVQASRPAIVFLNGEFWGLYNLQEHYSTEYIESHYGVPEEEVIIIDKGNLDEGMEEDIQLYNELMDYAVRNDLSKTENYDKISSMMDIENFIDYVSVEIIVGNRDWGSNNVRLWRSRLVDTEGSNPYLDGRWRFMLYDVEYSTGLSYENSLAYDANYNPSTYDYNSFNTVMSESSIIGSLFSNLIENDTFRKQFSETFMEIINSDLNVDTVNAVLDQYEETYGPMMVDTLVRFKPLTEKEAEEQFRYEVDKIRNFFSKRYDYIVRMMNYICQ